ncbi:type IV secretion system protein [Neisseria sp. Ec49-e6-T10]|uniref:type IV secretion system protein n=1 Tax=Neisseria sp. Ec49-e6-T10 TaxID=3140744 RepID=UPI003EBB5DE6
MGHFSSVSDTLLHGMGTNLFAKSANLISGIAPLFAAGFGVYILLVMISYYNRGLDENIMDFSKRMIGWLVIIACAFNAGTYNKLANLMYQMPESISVMLGTGEYSVTALDAAYDNFMSVVSDTFQQAKELPMTEIAEKIGFYFIGMIIFICGGIFFLAILSFYLVAKLSLAMVILIGPIFIGAMLFPATRQWGMNWIGQIFNYTITIVFYVILGSLQHDFFQNHVNNLLGNEIDSVLLLLPLAGMMCTSTLIFLVVAWNIPSIASALTGGASTGGIPVILRSIANRQFHYSKGNTAGGSIKRN